VGGWRWAGGERRGGGAGGMSIAGRGEGDGVDKMREGSGRRRGFLLKGAGD